MGYQTEYRLEILNATDDNQYEEVDIEIQKIFPDLIYACREWCYDGCWSAQEENMCVLSRAFPELLFQVNASGDYGDDVWTEYWQDGKYQHCQMVIPPYDPLQMKPYVQNGSGSTIADGI